MIYDIIIIGGGASGLCTAIQAKKPDNSILILEHNNKVGKKILSTGNGHCNLTNTNACVEMFEYNPEGIVPYMTSGNFEFIEKIIGRFDFEDTINFFAELGLLCTDKNGYIYPRSEQAASVLEILTYKCTDLDIEIITDTDVNKIEKYNDIFTVNSVYQARNVVIATGGRSGNKTGNDGSGYILAKKFGHEIIDPIPALCAIKCSDDFFDSIKGIRADGMLLVESFNKKIKVYGNIQFTDYGISGIPSFQISPIIGYMLETAAAPVVYIDFLPDISLYDLVRLIKHNYENIKYSGSDIDVSYRLIHGILNNRLCELILGQLKLKVSEENIDNCALALAKKIKLFEVHPSELMSFENAQSTAGGIFTDEIDPESMESLLINGLYFTGEVVDVNGICGGYNLQWAFSTAAVCASALRDK